MLAPQGFTFDIMPAGIDISIKKRVVRVITTRTALCVMQKIASYRLATSLLRHHRKGVGGYRAGTAARIFTATIVRLFTVVTAVWFLATIARLFISL